MARILVVDDQPELRVLLRDLLVQAGHTVLEAAGPHEAMVVAACEQPDVALIDYDLSARLHGVALLGRVRELSPRTRRVLMSGGAVPGLEAHTRGGLVQHFIAKPCSLRDLIVAVSTQSTTTAEALALSL